MQVEIDREATLENIRRFLHGDLRRRSDARTHERRLQARRLRAEGEIFPVQNIRGR